MLWLPTEQEEEGTTIMQGKSHTGTQTLTCKPRQKMVCSTKSEVLHLVRCQMSSLSAPSAREGCLRSS
jgi:hypothetical protein